MTWTPYYSIDDAKSGVNATSYDVTDQANLGNYGSLHCFFVFPYLKAEGDLIDAFTVKYVKYDAPLESESAAGTQTSSLFLVFTLLITIVFSALI